MPDTNYISAIIVDDEINAITKLKKLLGMHCPAIKVVETALGADTAALYINNLRPDVVFLDIEMPGKSGFELINMLQYRPMIVFVTGQERYAIDAIKVSAVDFLLKPVAVSELINVEKKLLRIKALSEATARGRYVKRADTVPEGANAGLIKKITLPDVQGYNIVDLEDVLYLKGADNYTSFYLNKHKKVVVSKTLKEYESLLGAMGFFRIHKSSIINLIHLKNINKENGLDVVMSDGRTLSVSRRRSTELLDKARRYLMS